MNIKFNRQEGDQDLRLEHGAMMDKLLKYPEFEYYQTLLDKLRMEWTMMVLTVDSKSDINRAKLMMIDQIIGIPDGIIEKGKQAQREEYQKIEQY